MRLELRDQMGKNEDSQSYDTYKSPINSQKLDFTQINKEAKPTVAAVNTVVPSSTNFDKIKGSKLFQKFM